MVGEFQTSDHTCKPAKREIRNQGFDTQKLFWIDTFRLCPPHCSNVSGADNVPVKHVKDLTSTAV